MLSASSRRQTCTSHSTPEAEIVAADAALRTESLPAIPLWEHLLKRRVLAVFKEYNEAVINICKAGGSMRLQHMNRTHRIDASLVAEQFGDPENVDKPCCLEYTHSEDQLADICTKRFTDPAKWLRLLYLINILHPSFWESDTFDAYVANQFASGVPNKPGGVWS